MKCTSELGETYLKVVAVLAVIGCIAIAGIFLNSDSTSQTDADEIVNSVILVAKQAKEQLDAQRQLEDQEENTAEERPALPSYKIEHEKYTFTVVEALSPELIKVDTGKEQISSGVCRALKKKFNEPLWPNIFKKVLIIDHAGKESSNIIIFDCPRKSVPSLRFYVHFKEEAQAQVETQPEQTDDVPQQAPQAAPVAPRPTTTSSSSSSYSSTRKAETSSYSPKTTCPIGTSPTGKGGLAKSGCKCMGSGEEWNGTNCELKNCPGNKVLQDGKCLCPEHIVQETCFPDSCV